MAKLALMTEMRARADARGMTLAALARAAEMQPSNLRRMLTSGGANPRLDTVMRLLVPLRVTIGPVGARTSSEVVEFLEAERRRRGATWRSLLMDQGRGAAAIVRRLKSDPGTLSLEIVMRLAEALEVELSLVDDESASSSAPTIGEEVDDRDAPPRRRSRRRSPADGDAAGEPASERVPRTPPSPSPSSPSPSPSPSPSTPTPASDPPPTTTPRWAPALRPPRLGRYRDAPPESPRPRAPAATEIPTPTRSSAPEYELERAILYKLADISATGWRRLYRRLGGFIFGTKDVPTELIDDFADRTADLLGRIRHPAGPGDPQDDPDPLTLIDAAPLLARWHRAAEPGDHSADTVDAFDSAGHHLVAHLSLDQVHGLVVRPARGDEPPALVKIVRKGSLHTELEIPLAVRVAGDLHPFKHVRAGAVLGEVSLGEYGYLLAGITASLTIIEITMTGFRAVWYGPAEDLPQVDLVPPRMAKDGGAAGRGAADGDAPVSSPAEPGRGGDSADEVAAAREQVAALDQQRSALAEELAATEQQLADERGARASIEEQLRHTMGLLEQAVAGAQQIWSSHEALAAELAQRREGGEGDPEVALRQFAEERGAHAEARAQVDELGRRAAALEDELAELRIAAEERAAVLEQQNAQLADELAQTVARLWAESAARAAIDPQRAEAGDNVQEMAALADALAEARATIEAEAEARATLEAELSTTRERLADESSARVKMEQAMERAVRLCEAQRASLAEKIQSRDALAAELASAREDFDSALAVVRGELDEEREAHAATKAQGEEEGRRRVAIEEEPAGARNALVAANEGRAALQDQVNRRIRADESEGADVAAVIRERDEARQEVDLQVQRFAEAQAAFEVAKTELTRERDEARAALASETQRHSDAQVVLKMAEAKLRRRQARTGESADITTKVLAEMTRDKWASSGSASAATDTSTLTSYFEVIAGKDPEHMMELANLIESPSMPLVIELAGALAGSMTAEKVADLQSQLDAVTAERDVLRVQFGAEERHPVRSSTFAEKWRKKKPPR